VGGNRRGQDHFGKRAKRENYPARSIYKLQEIDQRVRLLRPGMTVLDLGAAPGSWSLYAAERVTRSGQVVAVDRTPIDIAMPGNVQVITGNALEINPADLLARIDRSGFDAVISDMAPRTSGHRFVDQARSFELFIRALEFAASVCATGGSFVGKIFIGEDFEAARRRVRELFAQERIIRPRSIRTESYETYLVGLRRLPAPPSAPAGETTSTT
jgi:23S rRNA (uridine2552-2'-O)-methyltransferase